VAKVTTKLQVTVPKALADRYGIKPGDEIQWEAAGDVIRVVPARSSPKPNVDARLELFDLATARQRRREQSRRPPRAESRGWTREDLYDRGRAR
jgi:AbrB family looped-hinge helix DNA binding protein